MAKIQLTDEQMLAMLSDTGEADVLATPFLTGLYRAMASGDFFVCLDKEFCREILSEYAPISSGASQPEKIAASIARQFLAVSNVLPASTESVGIVSREQASARIIAAAKAYYKDADKAQHLQAIVRAYS